MNRDQIQQLLYNILDGLDCHPRLIQEILNIIAGSGYENSFFKLLLTRLNLLNQARLSAVKQKEFELLRDGIYSMHLSGKDFNIRILYAFLPDETPSLLACFYERAGKRKTDYSGKIELAKSRFEERLEAYENENEKE